MLQHKELAKRVHDLEEDLDFLFSVEALTLGELRKVIEVFPAFTKGWFLDWRLVKGNIAVLSKRKKHHHITPEQDLSEEEKELVQIAYGSMKHLMKKQLQ